ncbi:hypothetical protein F2Q70_00017428 [Brassica cretica]|uniref:Uncharacterized protein n=2 Tax=Brassica cretica TaxID=69181 RepID=A0A3N6PVQ4_BRACR|nr:hypothetical protein F2Q70_00017428 [Brassica cretica]KAF2577234.1 hypothetical protein F2Q68_00005400 [Brassica cretica]KAF3564623.1 hypothetical protein DY000_02016273 [Brassica cretica]
MQGSGMDAGVGGRASLNRNLEPGVLPEAWIFFPTRLPLISRFRPRTRGITCALKSTRVAHSQQASPGQDIAPVILLSQRLPVEVHDLGCIPLDVKTYSWGSWPEVVLSWFAQDLMEKRSMLQGASTPACRWQVSWAWRE